jgi:hypothetical protein
MSLCVSVSCQVSVVHLSLKIPFGNPEKDAEACQRARGRILATISDEEATHRTKLRSQGKIAEALDHSFHLASLTP